MKKTFLIIILSCLSFISWAQNTEEIKAVLIRQEENWNKGDISLFMEDYLKSDNLMFISKNGIIKGWQATKDRYLKSYPDNESMGKLNFEILEIDFHSKKTAWVLGKWHLKREQKGDIGGYFTLILKKIKNKWLIVSDHTS